MNRISIKNLSGDIIVIENIKNKDILEIKKDYIKYFNLKNNEIIDIDKLMFLDSNGNELWLGMKLSDLNIEVIYTFITPPYIMPECINIISPMSLPNDSISYFVFTYEKNKIGHPIVLSIGNIDIYFYQELGKHCFKYDPFEKNIFYNSKDNSKNSRLVELNDYKDNEYKIKVDIGDIGERRHKPVIRLREPLRNEVEKIETDLIFYKCTRIKLDS